MAGTEFRNGFCRQCNAPTMAVREGMSHSFHLLVSLFTCGAWILVWALLTIIHAFQPYRCNKCGTTA